MATLQRDSPAPRSRPRTLSWEAAAMMLRLKGAAVVEDVPPPDAAASATAVEAGETSKAPVREETIGELGATPGWNVAGEGLIPLDTGTRIVSEDWIEDSKAEAGDLAAVRPSMHMGGGDTPFKPQTTYSNFQEGTSAPSAASTATTNAPSSASASAAPKRRKKKKSRRRILDETIAVEPREGDVLSGRGGFTNTHPGNIRFRQKALELRPWYEESSKQKKQEIADLLVDYVRNGGNRFLGRGGDGRWHEMVGNGPHCKASQALRERHRGGREAVDSGDVRHGSQSAFLQE